MKPWLIIVCCMLTVLASCAHHRKAEIEGVRTRAQAYFDAGEYQKALDGFRGLHSRFSDDSALAASYIDMIETIKKQADKIYAREKYAAASRIYRLLLNNWEDFTAYQKKLSFSKSFLSERIKVSQIKLAENTSQQYISSGHFQKAIDVCREIYRKYRKDGQSQKCIVTVASELGEKGNAAYNNGEYAAAGKVYRVLRDNTEIFNKAEISEAPDMLAINTRLVNCVAHLNRKGLELYRKGDLGGALVVWKEILDFDPDNAEVRKAADVTSDQIKNMK